MEGTHNEENPDSPNLYLAFGSFQFQITTAAPEKFTGAQYLDFIRQSLGKIAAVGSIEIEAYEPLYESAIWTRPEKIPEYSETGLPAPNLQFVEISFTLHVPQRVQDALGKRGLSIPDTLGDDFVVKIRDGWQMPNAMVWPTKCSVSADASNAVIVVREILEEEFSRLKDVPVRLECLGPTPAHFSAELVQASSPQSEHFEQRERRRNGYHRYTFSYSRDLGSPEAVADLFHAEINSELDLHYRIVRARRQQNLAWYEATTEAQRILDAYRDPGLLSSIRRVMQGSHINRALIALAEIELDQRQELQNLQSEFDSTYEQGGHHLIKALVENMFGEFRPIPVEPLSRLLELFDSRRNTGRGVLIAAVASLIGAAVAAAATLITAG
jgi:hypothetical protein